MIFALTSIVILIFSYWITAFLIKKLDTKTSILVSFAGAKEPVVRKVYLTIEKSELETKYFNQKTDTLIIVDGNSMVKAPKPIYHNDKLIINPIDDITLLDSGVNILIKKKLHNGKIGLKVREFFQIKDLEENTIITRHHYEGNTPKEKTHHLQDVMGFVAYRIKD